MKYNKKRIISIFDKKAIIENLNKSINKAEKNIFQIAGGKAIEYLELTGNDILLDVGTGTGDKAINAARICQKVIGIDISKKSLEQARKKASHKKIDNVIFAYGLLENLLVKQNFTFDGITKILLFYSLHHLPNHLKKKSLNNLIKLLNRPGRIVIGDIMFFDDPNKHRDKFGEVYYDAGETDFPAKAEYLIKFLTKAGGIVQIEQIHPLVGIIVADFL